MHGSHGVILLARLDSARCPGKVLADAGGRPLIDRVVERLSLAGDRLGPIILATTNRPVDDRLAAWAAEANLPCVRHDGPVDDVAARFVAAAREHDLDRAFRVNADSPLVDAALLERALLVARRAGSAWDLVTNLRPRRHPYGIAVELVRIDALDDRLATLPADHPDREHVTRLLYGHAPAGRIHSIGGGSPAWAEVRTTVDTAEDLADFVRFLDRHEDRWPRVPLASIVPSVTRSRRVITLFCIHPHGFNVGNDAIHVALRSMIDTAFGEIVNVISIPATARFESHGRAGLTKSMVHEINQYGDGVIVGGGNLLENGQLDVDLGALKALHPPMMMFSLSRGRVHDRRGRLVDRTDVMPDATIRALHQASMLNVVRDRATFEHLGAIGCEDVRLGGCPTITLADVADRLPPVQAGDRDGLFVCVRAPDLMNIPLEAQARVRGQVEAFVADIEARTGERPRLLCHDHRDIPFAASFPGVEWVYPGDVHRFLALLRAARLVVTYRLHAAIPCLAFGTPFVNLTYDERGSSAIETIGLDAWNVDLMREAPIPAVLERLERLPDLDRIAAAGTARREQLRGVMAGAIDRFAEAVRDHATPRDPSRPGGASAPASIMEPIPCSSTLTATSM